MAGTFFIFQQISESAYQVTLLLSMKGVHKVFHVSFLNKHEPAFIVQQQQPEHKHVEIHGKEKCEVEDILNS